MRRGSVSDREPSMAATASSRSPGESESCAPSRSPSNTERVHAPARQFTVRSRSSCWDGRRSERSSTAADQPVPMRADSAKSPMRWWALAAMSDGTVTVLVEGQ